MTNELNTSLRCANLNNRRGSYRKKKQFFSNAIRSHFHFAFFLPNNKWLKMNPGKEFYFNSIMYLYSILNLN